MEFWDREREIEYLKRYIKSEPNAILFVYGPKSSGKSTLLMEVIDQLMADEEFSSSHTVYWFDLRGTLVSNYESVVDLFFVDEESARRLDKTFKFGINMFITAEVEVKRLMKEKRLDPFRYMERVLREDEKTGVIVFDELQKLKEVYLNSPSNQRPLVKELFNFFVRLTKVLHLSHVIVMTSDTFFIERVYTDSTLKNTSRFYRVDFFDDDTALRILKSKFPEDVSREIVDWIGGVPWMLEEVMESDEPKIIVEELYEQEKARLFDFLVNYRDENEVKKVLKEIIEGVFKLSRENLGVVRDLVEAEVLFYDPVNIVVKFQTKLDERAAEEILEMDR